MSTATLPQQERTPIAKRLLAVLMVTASIAIPALQARAKPATQHLRDHAYTALGLGFFSAAAFSHSLFAGLLVTGIAWFVFEWKVSDDGPAQR